MRGGVWRLTINKSQTEFENFRQVLKEILFLKYIHTPPPSLEKRSHRITVKSGFHNRLYHQIKMFHKDLKTRLSDYINHVKV